ncbi:MAG: exonuclease domain-containing protein [Ruminococcaceae bacterium]|nr:exonuclease domain-containing protein [Oscillospiraceae bacterium]
MCFTRLFFLEKILNYIIFDLEWNNGYSHALGKYINEIIEIGAVKLDSKLNIVDTFKQLVIPQYTKKLSSRCKRFTKITPEEIKENAIDFNSAFSDFERWSGNDDNVFMSWSNSDLFVLSHNYLINRNNCNISFIQKYCDVQKYCMAFVKKDESDNNQIGLSDCALKMGIEIDTEKLHRALSDCYVAAECFKKVYDAKKLSAYIHNCDANYFERLLFKPYYITEADSELFNVYKHDLTCPVCSGRIKPSSEYIIQNKAFKGAVRCRKCRKSFWVFIRAKKTYDDVIVKERFVEMNKKRARKIFFIK